MDTAKLKRIVELQVKKEINEVIDPLIKQIEAMRVIINEVVIKNKSHLLNEIDDSNGDLNIEENIDNVPIFSITDILKETEPFGEEEIMELYENSNIIAPTSNTPEARVADIINNTNYAEKLKKLHEASSRRKLNQ